MEESVRIGLRLRGSPADIAALTVLGERVPHLIGRPWTTFADAASAASVLTEPTLEIVTARALLGRGLDVVVWTMEGDDLRIVPLREGEAEERWTAPERRESPALLEALRPVRLPGEPIVGEALFVMDPGTDEPRRLLERLLLLDRGDATVCEFDAATASGGEARVFAVKVRAPPIYLQMRARDDERAAVQVYARDDASPLWVAWSFSHPLAEAAAADLRRRDQTALVDRRGRWLRGPAQWHTRSIYDALLPEIDARQATLRPVEGDLRFAIELRLAPGPAVDAELWLLDADELLALEPLIEGATGDELSRLTVARLTDGRRARYLLRERVRPGVPPIAARVSEALGADGYARVAGADNLYLPSGRRLRPMLRRDDLRRLLRLDEAHTVILEEDRDGLAVIQVPAVDEAPLLRWIDYVATDRRLALDQLLERSVFEFPDVSIAWPEVERVRPERPPPRERGPKKRPKRARVRIVADVEEAQEAAEEVAVDEGARLRELRAEARELERELAVGGVDDPDPWIRLGELKLALDEADEGIACLELGLFHGGAPHDAALAERLREGHLALLHREGGGDLLMELLIADRRTPGEVAVIAAILIARITAGQPPADEVMQLALPLFRDARLPIARRLAWSVLAAWHGHAGDRLGLTRAKEAILGGVNERGLSELHDLPRFVRYALAVDADDEASEEGREKTDERMRQGQLVALDELWRIAEERGFEELDPQANYVRLIFAVGFARLGARSSAQEIVASVLEEIDVHEVPNRGLYRLYLARLAHEGSGGSDEVWETEVGKQLGAIRSGRERKAVVWLQQRSLWLATAADRQRRRPGRRSGFALPEDVGLAGLVDTLAGVLRAQPPSYDYVIADAIEACVDRALASGSEALVAEVLAVADANLEGIAILGHRAEAIGHCIRGAASLGDDVALDHLLGRLVEVAENPKLGSVHELADAVRRALVALRRFGGVEPARGLLEVLAGVSAHTATGTIEIQSTVASGLVQLGEETSADAILSRLVAQIFDRSFDYVSRCEAGVAVASALRHWPNVARIAHCGRFVSELDVFRDTFTTNRYYDTHKILILEAVVDSLADALTRHSDQIQGYLDLEEHALRRRIIADWSALCGP
ncbi:MAG: hypothetical protein R3A79_26925 [Nannocystaceae bacterium]